MITLTYRATSDIEQEIPEVGLKSRWRPNHIRTFMRALRRNMKDRLLAYVWVAELQKRGEVHYHILLLVRKGTYIPYPDRSWWPHGYSKIETARSRWYILKYCSKSAFKTGDTWKDFPQGLRLFAVWVSPEITDELARFRFKLSALPVWLANTLEEIGLIVRARRARGGGWLIVGDTGPPQKVHSPYKLLSLYKQEPQE